MGYVSLQKGDWFPTVYLHFCGHIPGVSPRSWRMVWHQTPPGSVWHLHSFESLTTTHAEIHQKWVMKPALNKGFCNTSKPHDAIKKFCGWFSSTHLGKHVELRKPAFSWQFFVPCLGWLSDTFKGQVGWKGHFESPGTTSSLLFGETYLAKSDGHVNTSSRNQIAWTSNYRLPPERGYIYIHSLKLTGRTWKAVVKPWFSLQNCIFSGAMLVSGRVFLISNTYKPTLIWEAICRKTRHFGTPLGSQHWHKTSKNIGTLVLTAVWCPKCIL